MKRVKNKKKVKNNHNKPGDPYFSRNRIDKEF